MRATIRRAVAVGSALWLTAVLGWPTGAKHIPSHDESCVDPRYAGAFVCEYVAVTVTDTTDFDAVLAACPPAPLRIEGPIAADAGHQLFNVEVLRGTEVDHRDCYALQTGVVRANLGGVGSLTPPNTAAPSPDIPRSLLLVAGLSALFLVLVLFIRRRLPSTR